MPKAANPSPALNQKGKNPVPNTSLPFTYKKLYKIGPITFAKARKEDLSPANSPCGTLDLAPSTYKAAVTPNICDDARKPKTQPSTSPRKENSDAPMGASTDDRVAIAVKYLIPSLTTIWLPTMLAKILMTPITPRNDEKSFTSMFHSVLTRIWKVSFMCLGSDCIMITIANIRTSFECRKRILEQDDNGDCSSCFFRWVLFSLKGIRLDDCSVSCIPK